MIGPNFVPSEDSLILRDISMEPKNMRTKIQMIKAFISSVLDHLGFTNLQRETTLKNTSVSNLMACMRLFSYIAKGWKKADDLILLEKFLNLGHINEKLENNENLMNTKEFIVRFIELSKKTD